MNNYDNPKSLRLVPKIATPSTISAGAAGWVANDWSAVCGTDGNRIHIFIATCVSDQYLGARATGETATPRVIAKYATLLTKVNGAGSIDLYRNAANDVVYTFVGYFE